jgi:Fur family ferric uptake transcriptional regulator
VADAFYAADEHVTPVALAAKLQAQGYDLGEAFVTETLELLCRFGFAQRKDFAGGRRYEHRHLDDHHDHLICAKCGRIEEFFHPDLEALQLALAAAKGYRLLDHRHQLYGLCPACQEGRAADLPLAAASAGERVRVTGYLGGRQSQQRLADMGLTPGTEIEVLTSEGGPMMIACRGARLAVGQQLATKLTCRPVGMEKWEEDD